MPKTPQETCKVKLLPLECQNLPGLFPVLVVEPMVQRDLSASQGGGGEPLQTLSNGGGGGGSISLKKILDETVKVINVTNLDPKYPSFNTICDR